MGPFDPQPDAWVPFQLDARRVDAGNLFTVTGRLTPGVTRAAANGEGRASRLMALSQRIRPFNPWLFACLAVCVGIGVLAATIVGSLIPG